MKELKLFIAAVPLFTSDMSVEAYRLHYQDSNKLFGLADDYTSLDGAMHSPGLDMLNKVGIEPFTGGKPIFIPINKYQLLSDFITDCKISPKLINFVLPKELPKEEVYLKRCRALKDAGYSFAISGMGYSDSTSKLFKMSDYVIMDTTTKDYLDKLKEIKTQQQFIRVIFTKVADLSVFGHMKMIENSLYEGRFYNQPLTKGVKDISPLKTNALRLLRMVGDEDYDLGEVSKIIQQDISLSIALLKFINSPAIRIANKISSIQNAVALLGQKETRKWIMAFVSMQMGTDKPNEITKLSLTRAKFAENLATSFEMGIHAPSLFLMGLFSLLDVILDLPMKDAIEEILVSDAIKAALVDSKGEFADVLKLIYAYERADWKTVSYIMILRGIKPNKLNRAFFDSLVWYKELLDSLKE